MNKKDLVNLRNILYKNPDLDSRFKKFRSELLPIKPSQYDITNKCNLTCVGCLYFDGDQQWNGTINRSSSELEKFFKAERKRGVNFPHFGGAEPALNQKLLHSASQIFNRGVIYSNGTLKIEENIRFKIHISVWSDMAQEAILRGKKNVFSKAIDNYRNDDRAVFVYTISALSFHSVESIVAKCAKNGVKVTFNHYSPPIKRELDSQHLSKSQIKTGVKPEDLFLDGDMIDQSNDVIDDLKIRYPDTIIYSAHYGQWLCNGIYTVDDNGWAVDCASRLDNQMRHFNPDLSREQGTKCCTPNIECSTCRLYSMAYATKINQLDEHLNSAYDLKVWLDIVETWRDLFILTPKLPLEVANSHSEIRVVEV